MKEITKLMINEYRIMKLKMDFMGYSVQKKESLSFHKGKRIIKPEYTKRLILK